MKKTIYFKEDAQELLETPINDSNCYYLGELGGKTIDRIKELGLLRKMVEEAKSLNNGNRFLENVQKVIDYAQI